MATKAICIQAPILQVVIEASGGFTVIVGECINDRLNWDEMMGTVARLTHPKLMGQPSYGLAPPVDWVLRHQHRREIYQRALEREVRYLRNSPDLTRAIDQRRGGR